MSVTGSDFSLSDSDDGFAPKKVAKKAVVKKPLQETNVSNAPARPKKAPAKKAVPKEDSGDEMVENVEKKSTGPRTVEEIYQKKTQLEHILLRPDTYIGSVEMIKTPMWVLTEDGKMIWREVSYVPGLYKIFDEILVNAADNKIRDPGMDTLKVNIDRLNNTISVWNNGHGIPVEMHSKEGVYVPELIFGHLLTSSNYDDSEKKVTGGRNGYGAKLCNIFSTEFIVETADRASGKKFKQVYTKNMGHRTNPEISSNSRNEEWTCITFRPDLAKFGMSVIDDDLYALFRKRVYDMCGSVKDVKVFLNGERVKVKDFKAYTDMYLETQTPKPAMVFEKISDRWEVGFAVSEGQFQQVSFVNSINTYKGGTHVTYVADQLVTKIQEAVKKKNKNGAPVKPFQIKNHMWLFVNCLIENPTFDSQTKENMTLKASSFGSKPSVSEDFVKKVLKSGIIESILSFAKFKQEQQMKKTDGSKKSRIAGITKLDDANNAGTRNAKQCTLILTEGDSAKALAVSGLSVVGRDDFGVFPLRGKLLNVREANAKQLMENQEIQNIKQILGLQQGKVYEDASSLRYGHIMIMTDQDHDGSHIKGLIVNFLDHFWPSLLKIPGFLQEFITPIVKVSKGKGKDKKEISFFTIPEYEHWKEEHEDGKGWTIKYYKGLGTSTSEDAKKYFGAMALHRKPFKALTDGDRELVDMAFNKKKADDRKDWLRRFQPGTFMDHTVREIPIADFINKELILFSVADNIRSIPNVVDGLKPGHRKIMFACFKRNLKNEIKVAQLAGYVAEHSAYHHGEQSLCATIVGLAQNFVGSNNVNLLEPIGQFGTRLQGGKDAASPRYIFTHLSPITRTLFHPSDDALLSYLTEDGQNIEPEWYMPVIPLLLVNGAEGIGTGWSTMIPNYNPRDIVDNLRRLLLNEPQVPMKPWYRGFKGTIEGEGDKFKVTGTLTKIDNNTIEVTELPIRSWTQSYKEQLEGWLVASDKSPALIKDYKEYHTDTSVHFVITLTDEQMEKAEAEGLEKRFKMTTVLNTSNMVCFDHEGRIKKYNSVEEILQDFFELRLHYYQKRKEHLADQLTQEWTRLDNKVRFVTEIIQGKLVVQNRKKTDLLNELTNRGYTPFYKSKAGEEVEEEEDSTKKGHGYDYLLSMPIWSLTMEKVQNLQKDRDGKQVELDRLLKLTAKDLWNQDLDQFLQEWDIAEQALDEVDRANKLVKAKKGKPLKPVKNQKKKKNDSDSELSEEFSDDDFVKKAPVKKEKVPVVAKPTVTKPSVLESKLAAIKPTSKFDDSDDEKGSFADRISRLLATGKDPAQDNVTKLASTLSSVTLKEEKKEPVKKAPAKPAAVKKAPIKKVKEEVEEVVEEVVAKPRAGRATKPVAYKMETEDEEEEESYMESFDEEDDE